MTAPYTGGSGYALGKGIVEPRYTGPSYPTIGPRTAPHRPEDEEGYENPYLAAIRSMYGAAQAGGEKVMDFMFPGIAPATRALVKGVVGGLGHDVGALGQALQDRNVPGAGGREAIFNAALPLALNFYPMGAAPAVAERGAAVGAHALEEAIRTGAMGKRSPTQAFDEVFGALKPEDAPIIEQIRSQLPDVSHYTDEELRTQGAVAEQKLAAYDNPEFPATRADNQIERAHLETHRDAIRNEEAVRGAQKQQAAAGPRPLVPGGRALESRTEATLRELGYDHSTPGVVPGPGGNAGGRMLLGEKLSREDAIALNRESQTKGLPTEMRRNADGTFEVWQKGEGAAAPKVAERAAAKDERRAKALSVLTDEERAVYEALPEGRRADHPLDDKVFAMEEALGQGMSDEQARNFAIASQEHAYARLEGAKVQKEMGEIEQGPSPAPGTPEFAEVTRKLNELDKRADALLRMETEQKNYMDQLKDEAGAVTKAGGLMPSEAEKLRVLREQQEELQNGLDHFERVFPDGYVEGPDTDPRWPQAAAEARASFERNQKQIADLEAREHLPPAAEKALVKRKENLPAQQYPYGEKGTATESGFQSRAVTVLKNEYDPHEVKRAQEWYETLLADKRIPKAEIEAVLGGKHASQRLMLDDQFPEGVPADAILQKFTDDSPASTLERKVLKRVKRDDLVEGVDDEADDATRDLTEEEQDEMNDAMFERAHENVMHERQQGREQAIQDEERYYAEQEAEYYRTERIPEALSERDEHLDTIESLANEVLGEAGGKRFMEMLKNKEFVSEDGTEFTGPVFKADEIVQMGNDDLTDLANRTHLGFIMDDVLNSLKGDPAQLRLGEDIPAPGGAEGTLADVIRREFSDDDMDELSRAWEDALEKQDEAFTLAKAADEGDFDHQHIREMAEESVDNDEAWATEGDDFNDAVTAEMDNLDTADFDPRLTGQRRGNQATPNPWITETEYHTFQRVDESRPYREILLHSPQSKLKAGHYTAKADLMGHARMEIHDDTGLLIESQSDASAEVGQRQKSPFMKVKNWTQANAGATLYEAAKEDLGYFAWVNGANRARRNGHAGGGASLNPEAAELFYDKETPAAIERICEQLGIEFKPEPWTPEGLDPNEPAEVFTRIKLSAEDRARILKAGIPTLGIGAVTVRSQQGE